MSTRGRDITGRAVIKLLTTLQSRTLWQRVTDIWRANHMKSAGLAVLLLLWVGTTYGQAYEYTLHLTSPINETLLSNCGEGIQISGTVHGVIHLTRQNDGTGGSVSVESHVGPHGDVTATTPNGQVYNVVGDTFTRLQFGKNVLEGFSYENTFNVVGLMKIRYTYHLLLGDNYDTPKSYVDSLRIICSKGD